MTALAACVRARLRGSVRSTLLFVALAGLAGGVLLGGLAGARRTESAYRRMLDETNAGHLLVYAPTVDPEAMAALPEVEDLGRLFYVYSRYPTLEDEGQQVVPFAAADDHLFRTLDRLRVLEGRTPDPTRVDEVAISEGMADRYGLAVGDRFPIRLFTLEEALASDSGEVRPTGPLVDLRVTAIARGVQDVVRSFEDAEVEYAGSEENLRLTPAFYDRYVEPVYGSEDSAARVRLRNGDADLASFTAGVQRLAGDGIVAPEPQRGATERVERSTDVLALALALFSGVAGLLGLLLVSQALARQGVADLAEVDVLRALGIRRSGLVAVGVSRAAAVGLGAAFVAVVLAVAVSPLFPVGLARLAEPDPGLRFDGTVLLPGALVVALLPVVLVAVSVRLRLRQGRLAAAEAGTFGREVADRVARSGLPVTGTTGVRMALDGGRGARSVPLRTTLAGAAIGLAAVTAVLVFGQSLDRLVDDPARQGWTWDVVVGNPNGQLPVEDAEAALAGEPIVDGFTAVATASLPVGDAGVSAISLDPVEGAVLPPLLDGRFPVADDEVALDLQLLRDLDVDVGDRVPLLDGDEVHVVGEVAFPDALLDIGEGSVGGAVMSPEGIAALDPEAFPTRWFVDLAPGVGVAEARRALGPTFGRTVLPPVRPDDLENLASVAWMPAVLAGLIAAFAMATIGHVLVAAIRRRRDLAILKTLGLDHRGVRSVVAWQATTLGVLAALVGIPLGLVAGRWAWVVVADGLGARSAPLVDAAVVVLLVVAVLVVLNAIAAVPARVAARLRPAVVLRSE